MRDAHQPAHGLHGEIRREVGDHQEAKRLGHFAGAGVVLLDGLELVAEILLDHVFHVSGQVGEALLDVPLLGPDAAADHGLVVIGQMHEGSKILAQADRIEDREPHLARR